MKKITLKKGKEESLLRFHPWVFSGAIQRADEGVSEGEIVRVVTNHGDFIAIGHYQQGSIAVRVLTFSDVAIDAEFWASRLASALKMRQSIGIADNPMVRVIICQDSLSMSMVKPPSCRPIASACTSVVRRLLSNWSG